MDLSAYTTTGHKLGFGLTRKLPRFGNHKRVNIRNMDIVCDRRIPGLWRGRNSKFLTGCGINQVSFISHFTPAVEVGWRLDFEHWRQGYATEGAIASLRYGFETLHLNEIVSLTVPENFRSRAVMEKIGMHRNPKDDFDHPRLSEGHKLRRHVLYRISRNEFFEKYQKLQS